MDTIPEAENVAMRPGVGVTASVMQPHGGGARDPHVVLNETATHLHGKPLADFDHSRTYNTYDGQNQAHGPDWYQIEFPVAVTCNCVEMTMGVPYRDGGWWTSLAVEVRDPDGMWHEVAHLASIPAYNFTDERGQRRPYETHALLFHEVTTTAIRLTGTPGGLAQFTSIARLAVYSRDLSRWNLTSLPTPPVPYIFQLILPETIWDLSENMAKLTGLAVRFPLMENYIDASRYQRYWERIRRNYQGEPDLWFLVGESIGWNAWRQINVTIAGDPSPTIDTPHVRLSFYGTLASAIAPVVVDGQVLGEMTTRSAIFKDTFSLDWHQHYAAEHDLPWNDYAAALARSPQMSLEQLEGAAMLMGMIANMIANLVHGNLLLQHQLEGASNITQRARERKEMTRRAIDIMQERLEEEITVADVASRLALNPSYFCTLFTEQTGRNPSEYLIELRLERAKEYLVHTRMSVMEVCIALGYTPSYFSRLFKQRVGCTPGQYAQRMRGNA